MRYAAGAPIALLVCTGLFLLVGCGSGSDKFPSDTCTGLIISGTLQDSLTRAPLSRASVVLESGTHRSLTPVFDFAQTASTSTDSQGAFRLCAQSLPPPSVLVIVGLDSSGKAYPPLVTRVTGAADLGDIPMGMCRGICFLEQQQTSLPATISGAITTAPSAKTGSVVPQFPMDALDGSRTLWGIAMPVFNAQSITFTTTAGNCAGGAPFCAAYSFTVPSQKPVVRLPGQANSQEAGWPDYAVWATVNGAPSCTPPFALTIVQQDGLSTLTAVPGVSLTAHPISFTACQ